MHESCRISVFYFVFLLTSLTWVLKASCVEPTKGSPENTDDFVETVLHPFWLSDRIREPVFFIQSHAEERPSSSLLFVPNQIVVLTSSTRKTTYQPGVDYRFDPTTNRISLPKGSRIPFKTEQQMHPLMTSDEPKIGLQRGNSAHGIFFDITSGYHHRQAEVTYTCQPNQWKGPRPEFASDALTNLMKKLGRRRPVQILLLGDSISAGLNASAVIQAEPGCPAYGELVALALQSEYGSPVQFANYAISGTKSGQGLQRIEDEKVREQQPDLAIVAYGMNDIFGQDAKAYQDNIRDMIESIHSKSPQAEYLLVASMLGNAEWGMPIDQFPLYRDALSQLCGQGIVLADLTSIWEELLKHKSFYDLTGNGVNHPNGFGHRVYAQTILSLLVE